VAPAGAAHEEQPAARAHAVHGEPATRPGSQNSS
jgi:hypothetical protein